MNVYVIILSLLCTHLSFGSTESLEASEIMQYLNLTPAIEGGFSLPTYRSGSNPFSNGLTDPDGDLIATDRTPPDGDRNIMTGIYYMLNKDKNVLYWRRGKSDSLRFYHSGDPVDVYMILPNATLVQRTMGLNLREGQLPMVIVPGGNWEALVLQDGPSGYSFFGKVNAPGFDKRDSVFADESLAIEYPALSNITNQYLKPAAK